MNTATVRGSSAAHHLLVRAGADLCAIPLAQVRRVMTPGRVYPLPGAAAELLGLTEYQGEPLPVIDLPALVAAAPAGQPENPVIVVVWAGPPDRREAVGLHTDAALEILSVPGDGVAPAERGIIVGEVAVGEKTVILLDPMRLGAAR